MDSTIVQTLVALLGVLAARGLDYVIAKWMAYFTIAWERVASKRAMDMYTDTKNSLVKDMDDKSKEWDNWRKTIKK